MDFFFPEVRLAIELDGGHHGRGEQAERDRIKEKDCRRFDITLVRFTNAEVFGNRTALVERLRKAWATARARENVIVGKDVPVNPDPPRRGTMGRFPPPWKVEPLDGGGFKIVDSNGQSLAYVYGHADVRDAQVAKALTLDEARRIASNIAKLPSLLGKGS